MPEVSRSAPRLPPRWVIRAAWAIHRGLFWVTRGKLGLWPPKPGGWGALRLTTIGRHTGKPRSVIIGYIVDGTDYVGIAMNGWGAAQPAWWLNLQTNPIATVQTRDWLGSATARAVTGEQRDRLWSRWKELEPGLDGFAAIRNRPTAVVVLEAHGAAT